MVRLKLYSLFPGEGCQQSGLLLSVRVRDGGNLHTKGISVDLFDAWLLIAML